MSLKISPTHLRASPCTSSNRVLNTRQISRICLTLSSGGKAVSSSSGPFFPSSSSSSSSWRSSSSSSRAVEIQEEGLAERKLEWAEISKARTVVFLLAKGDTDNLCEDRWMIRFPLVLSDRGEGSRNLCNKSPTLKGATRVIVPKHLSSSSTLVRNDRCYQAAITPSRSIHITPNRHYLRPGGPNIFMHF